MTNKDKTDPILIDVPMPIETPRLILRPKQAGDGAASSEAVLETWDQLNKWMPWADSKENHSPEKQEIHARRCAAQFILREDIVLIGVEKDTGSPVIWTGLHRFNWNTRRFEIGYWVRESAQGKGYATESTIALARYAFEALGARRVEINHAANNDKSRRVIKKVGFEEEGIKRNYTLLPDGTFVDEVFYSLCSTANLPELDVRWGS